MREWLDVNPDTNVRFDCIDFDTSAIAYASRLCEPYADRIKFVNANVLRYRPKRTYDLVWAAGLFDYFDDRVFAAVMRRMLSAVRPHGRLVVGNFSVNNPTRAYMELGGWILHHRTAEELVGLAKRCGDKVGDVCIGMEPEGVNLFVHVSPS